MVDTSRMPALAGRDFVLIDHDHVLEMGVAVSDEDVTTSRRMNSASCSNRLGKRSKINLPMVS